MFTKKSATQSTTSLIAIIFILVVFGLVMLASASSVVSYASFNDSYHFLKHQFLYGFLPGLFFFLLCSRINYKVWKKYSFWLLLGTIILLILVFTGIGVQYHGARSWINLGFSLQPSEIAKLTLLIYLSAWFAKSKEHVKSLSHGLIPFMIFLGIIAGLIALQPDTGTLSIIIMIALGVYFVAGARISHLAILVIVGLVLFSFLVLTAPYRMERIKNFLKPGKDPQNTGYHIDQSLIAIGSGGLFGLGFGHSRQKFEYLPEVAGDSIFAIMAEELGFILSVMFIILLVYFIIRILRISQHNPDNFAKFFTAGLAVWIGGQALINISAMAGLLPLTGIPLPFVSYGGTALMTVMAGCGILVNISRGER